jgi:hypothetical protein
LVLDCRSVSCLVAPLVAALPPADLAALKALFATKTQVPTAHDRALLRVGRVHHGQTTLTESERTALRRTFVRLVLAK